MASSIEKLVTLQMKSADNVYTVPVHPDVQEKCMKDTKLATNIFLRLAEKYKVDSSGHRNLSIAESYELVAEFGLLDPVSSAAKDNGVNIKSNNMTEFDSVSTAAYTQDVSEETLCRLGMLIPKQLSSQEHLVASVPNDSSGAKSSNSSTDSSIVGASASASLSSPVEDDLGVDTLDDSESVFSTSNATGSSWSSQTSQSEVRINWTEDQVRLLVELRRQNNHLFASSVVTQKQAWRKVSEEMATKGYNYSGDDCQRKFGSMRLRHKTIRERNQKTGRGRSAWKFFSIMEEMFAGDPAVSPLAEVSSVISKKNNLLPTPEKAIIDSVVNITPCKLAENVNSSNSKEPHILLEKVVEWPQSFLNSLS